MAVAPGWGNATLKTVFVYVLLGVSLCTGPKSSLLPSSRMKPLLSACDLGCECHDLVIPRKYQLEDSFCKQEGLPSYYQYDCGKRFTVNCTYTHRSNQYETPHKTGEQNFEMELNAQSLRPNESFFMNMIPGNTTDLILSNFQFMINSSQTHQHPQLFALTVSRCWVEIPFNAFQGNLFKFSIRSIYIHDNVLLDHYGFQKWPIWSMYAIPKGIFRELPFVENISVVRNTLRANSNLLAAVETEAFYKLPEVKVINLTRNYLREIQPEAFYNLPHLTTLDLSYNSLQTIPGKDIVELSRSSLKKLYLKENRWDCSCEILWILGLNTSILADFPVCHSPPELKGTHLQNLTANSFRHCYRLQVDIMSMLKDQFVVALVPIGMCTILLYCRCKSRRSKRIIGQIEIDTNEILGDNVYKGKLQDGRPVAVKRVPPLSIKWSKELDILLKMSKDGTPHPNVIQYLIREETKKETYIALELCNGNLKNLLRGATSRKILSQLTERECLYQIAKGLHHLHKCGIEHRDIKPSNILYTNPVNKFGKLRFIISDFDMGHFTKDQSLHNPFGSIGWRPPEFWNRGPRTSAVDIFSMGRVFFYVLTRGEHPFGSPGNMDELQESIQEGQESVEEWQENIENNCFSLDGLFKHSDDKFGMEMAKDLISSMIHNEPSRRPEASKVTEHPLFWNSKEQVNFFHQIGNYLQNEQISQVLVERLERDKSEVFRGSWLESLDKAVRSDLRSYRERQMQLCTLLRVIRNKIDHIQNIESKELRKIYGGCSDGVVQYYNKRFPKLLVYTYTAWEEVGNQLPE